MFLLILKDETFLAFFSIYQMFFKLEGNLPPRLAWLLLAGQKPETKRKTLDLQLTINNLHATYQIIY